VFENEAKQKPRFLLCVLKKFREGLFQQTVKIADLPALTYDALAEHIRLAEVNADEYSRIIDALRDELGRRDPTNSYACAKCGHKEHEVRELRGTGGFISSIFNVQSEKYKAVICRRCKFAEFYHGKVSDGQVAMDVFLGQ
jgi:uncharacterized protein